MAKSLIIVAAVQVFISIALHADLADDLHNDPQLSSAFVPVSPESLYDAMREKYMGQGLGCEQGENFFYQLYVERLRLATDSTFPEIAKYREGLVKTFLLINHFLACVMDGGTGFGHARERIPATVEWDLYHGAANKFEFYEQGYSIKNIKDIAVILANAYLEPPRIGHPPLAELDTALKQLAHTEEHMPQNMKLYFRAKVMQFLGTYL